MKIEFPKVIQAAQAKEGATWKLADAVLAAVDKPVANDSQSARLERMATELERHVGRDYHSSRLYQFAATARAFPPSRRKKGMTFEVCNEAGTPETLAAITSAAKQSDREVSKRLIRRVVTSHAKRHADMPRAERPALTDEDAQRFFRSADIMGDFASVLVKLRGIHEALTPDVVAELSEAMVGAYAEDCEIGAGLFRDIRSKLRGKKGHLAVVA